MRSQTRLLPGVKETLEALRHRGTLLAVCSNKPVRFTKELLEFLGIAAWFSAVLGPEDVARPKPAPDMLVEALGRLKIPLNEAIYIGDMVVDIETARACGVRVWVVPTGSDERATLVRAKPDRLCADFNELRQALLDTMLGLPLP